MQTTQQYCIAETMDLLTNALKNVPAELQGCWDRNLLVLHPEKCKAMIMQRKSTFTGPIQALRLGNNINKWTTSERLSLEYRLITSCPGQIMLQMQRSPSHRS